MPWGLEMGLVGKSLVPRPLGTIQSCRYISKHAEFQPQQINLTFPLPHQKNTIFKLRNKLSIGPYLSIT